MACKFELTMENLSERLQKYNPINARDSLLPNLSDLNYSHEVRFRLQAQHPFQGILDEQVIYF